MKQLLVKLAEPKDHSEIVEWLNGNPSNQFDSAILSYPTLQVVTAYNGRNVMHLPMHKCMVMESLAINPEATEMEKAQALRDLTKAAELLASQSGIKELYFEPTEDQVKAIATNPDVGFKIVTMAKLRL